MSLRSVPSPVERQEDPEAEFEQLLYHITHDLRASLRALRTLPEWLRDDICNAIDTLPPDVEEGLDILLTHTVRMDQMLLDLRTYSRVGRLSDRAAPLMLDEALSVAAEAVGWPKSASLRADFGVRVIAAPANEIELLFGILLDNAMKHAGGHSPAVRVSAQREGDRLEILFRDEGPGIPNEHCERVFKMLSTLRPRDEVEGSGMGLAIARKICRTHSGEISLVEDATCRGACFRVDLPASLIVPDASGPSRLAQS